MGVEACGYMEGKGNDGYVREGRGGIGEGSAEDEQDLTGG